MCLRKRALRIGLPGAEGFQHLQDHHSPAGSDVDPQHIAPQLQFRLVGLLGEEPPLNEALAGAVQQILLSLPTGVPHHDLCHALEDSAQGVHLLRVPGDADDPYRLPVQLDGEVDARADAAGAAVLLDRQPGQLLGQDLAVPLVALPHTARVRAGKDGARAVHDVDVVACDLLHLADNGEGRCF